MISRISASALAAGAVVLLAHTAAYAQPFDNDDLPRERVVFPSVLLQTQDGRERVVQRLRTAARNVCVDEDDGLLTSARPECERRAFDNAMHQVFPDGPDAAAAASDNSAG